MGLAPRGAGMERVQAPHVPGAEGWGQFQPLTAVGGGSFYQPPTRARTEEPTQKAPGCHECPLGHRCWFPLLPVVPLSAAGKSPPWKMLSCLGEGGSGGAIGERGALGVP